MPCRDDCMIRYLKWKTKYSIRSDKNGLTFNPDRYINIYVYAVDMDAKIVCVNRIELKKRNGQIKSFSKFVLQNIWMCYTFWYDEWTSLQTSNYTKKKKKKMPVHDIQIHLTKSIGYVYNWNWWISWASMTWFIYSLPYNIDHKSNLQTDALNQLFFSMTLNFSKIHIFFFFISYMNLTISKSSFPQVFIHFWFLYA